MDVVSIRSNRLARLLADGARVPIQETYDLAQASDALAALAEHTQGKLAIRVS